MYRFKAAAALLLIATMAACAGPSATSGPSPRTAPIPASTHSPARQPLDTLGGGPVGYVLAFLLGDSVPQLEGKTLAHLYVGVDRVDVTNTSGQTATVQSFSTPQVVDVLQYQGSAGANIANSGTTTTTYNSVTFVFDIPSSQAVFTDGTSAPLQFLIGAVPQSSSGADQYMTTRADGASAVDVTSSIPFSVPANGTQNIRADFNAFETLAFHGSILNANPVIFAAPLSTSGVINGNVLDSSGNPVSGATVVAYRNGIPSNTAYTGSNGSFELTTLSSGSYQLVVFNKYTNAAGKMYNASGQTNYNASVNEQSVTLGDGQTINAGTLSD